MVSSTATKPSTWRDAESGRDVTIDDLTVKDILYFKLLERIAVAMENK